jgi:TIGR00159 family protein
MNLSIVLIQTINFFKENASTILSSIRTVVDILMVWAVLYYLIGIVKKNDRTLQIFKGILLIVILRILTNLFQFAVVGWLVENILTWGVVAVIIIFQPEIRTALEKLGRTEMKSSFETLSDDEKNRVINEIVITVEQLVEEKVGALITFERKQSLIDMIATGVSINADINSALLLTIFKEGTILHDGAVIIQGNKIACASAFFPPTEKDLPPKYGARHRAALGLSEINDSMTIIVSEETGTVSIAENSKFRAIPINEFKQELIKEISGVITGELVKDGGKDV